MYCAKIQTDRGNERNGYVNFLWYYLKYPGFSDSRDFRDVSLNSCDLQV